MQRVNYIADIFLICKYTAKSFRGMYVVEVFFKMLCSFQTISYVKRIILKFYYCMWNTVQRR